MQEAGGCGVAMWSATMTRIGIFARMAIWSAASVVRQPVSIPLLTRAQPVHGFFDKRPTKRLIYMKNQAAFGIGGTRARLAGDLSGRGAASGVSLVLSGEVAAVA